MREMRTIGKVFTAHIEIYNGCKYDKESGVIELAKYSNIKEWEIVTEDDANEIEKELERRNIELDRYHEYLVLHLTDGNTATFKNSCVEMFKVYN